MDIIPTIWYNNFTGKWQGGVLITFDALQNEAKEQFKENVLQEARIIYERGG